MLIDFCLIFVPFGHYDEPEILRYAITSIRPKGADVRQGWVTERHKCTLDVSFVMLKKVVTADAEEANGLLPERRFLVNGDKEQELFIVTGFPIARSPNSDKYKFIFQLDKDKIIICRNGPDTLPKLKEIVIKQRWCSSRASCFLYVGEREVSVEEISQLVLEAMLFE